MDLAKQTSLLAYIGIVHFEFTIHRRCLWNTAVDMFTKYVFTKLLSTNSTYADEMCTPPPSQIERANVTERMFIRRILGMRYPQVVSN